MKGLAGAHPALTPDPSESRVDAFAEELIAALDAPQPMAPFTTRDPSFDVRRAYEVAARVHAARRARGEQPVGRKIGFTNRNIWDEYGVHEPIWGFVYDTTLFRPRGGHASVAIGGFAEPRIEPEIVLHFKSAPPVTRSEAAILDCIDWIAAGFEIVHSPFPDWKFKVADTIAGNGLHGILVVGDPVPVASIPDCAKRLREFRITLKKGAAVAAEGGGANVLDSPLLAFAHLADVLAHLPQSPPVAAGEVVTTGTLTSALRVAPGETWSTTIAGIGLPGLSITFR
ncbi:MAG: 2-keto-4-pentenoate hydratase [Bacteroidota bacterium]|jgi:2-oxo-3-hexenedioate decarboxylase|nr:fumarylacetoacetate hydrolase family protein [Burkholderiales bacterium]